MRLPHRLGTATLAAASALAALAAATATAAAPADPGAVAVTLSSPVAGTGTRVMLEVDGSRLALPPGVTPSGLALVVQRGFRVDPTAVAGRCARADLERFACPSTSRIGDGVATAVVTAFGLAREVTVDIDAFLAPPVRAGDVAGIAVTAQVPELDQRFTTTGRIVRLAAPDGLALRFDDLAGGARVPAGVTIALRSVRLEAGATRTVTVRRTVSRRVRTTRRVRGRDGRVRSRRVTVTRRVKVTRRERRHLIATPSSCTGSWSARATVALGGGGEVVVPVAVPCRAAARR